MKVKVLQHILVAVRVLERYILKGDIPVQRFPVLLQRSERVSVPGNHFRRIPDVRLRLHQSGKTLHIHLHGDQIGNSAHNPLNRLHQAQCIRHEDGQSTDLDHPLQGNDAAPPQHHSQRHRRRERDHRREQSPIMHRMYGSMLHLGSGFVKILLHFLLDHQCLGSLGTGDTFVEVAGDLGIDLPDTTV